MTVPAQFPGFCGPCEEPIIPGEAITNVGGSWIHAVCNRPAPKRGEICDRCFMEKSVTGECANCD